MGQAVAPGMAPVANQARSSAAVPTQIERSTGVAMPGIWPDGVYWWKS